MNPIKDSFMIRENRCTAIAITSRITRGAAERCRRWHGRHWCQRRRRPRRTVEEGLVSEVAEHGHRVGNWFLRSLKGAISINYSIKQANKDCERGELRAKKSSTVRPSSMHQKVL